MKKRYIIPASIAALTSAATAMPIHLLAFNDAIEGNEINQGLLLSILDRNNKQLENVKVEVYNVSSISANNEGTYDLSGLQLVKSYTTQSSDEEYPRLGLGLNAGKYVVKVTPPDGYVVGKYDNATKNANNEFVIEVPDFEGASPYAFTACDFVFFETDTVGEDVLTLTVTDTDGNVVPNVVFNVTREALDGTIYNLGDYSSDSNGKVLCPADTNDAMPAGSQYVFTIKEYPTGYQKAYFDKATLQAVEGYNSGFIFVQSATTGTCTITVQNDFMQNVSNFPLKVVGEDGTEYKYTTDTNGVAVISNLPEGNYTVHYGGNNPYISYRESSFTVSTYNTELIFLIADTTPIANGTVMVMNENYDAVSGLPCKIYNDKDVQVWSGILNEDGEMAVYSLPYGDYKLVLSDVPNTYMSEDGTYTHEFTIAQDEFSTAIVLLNNPELYGDCSIELEITDADTDDYILGETVKVLNENNVVLQEVEMDDEGVAMFENLPEGTYHFELSEDSSYYILENQSVYVGGHNKSVWSEIQAKKNTTTLVLSTQCNNSEIVSELFVSLYKNGVIFGTFKMSNGSVTIPNLTIGDYEIVVNDVLTGYKLTSDTTFMVTTSDRLIQKTLVFEEKQSSLNIKVKDTDSGDGISNVLVTIKDASGNTIVSSLTNELGELTNTLPYGSYTVSAITPNGYAVIEDQTITLTSETGHELVLETQLLTCSLDLEIKDSDGNAVYGGSVQVVNSKNEVVHTVELNGVVNVTIPELPLDTYTIKVVNCDTDTYLQPETISIALNEEKNYTQYLTFDKVLPAVTTGSVNITMYDEDGTQAAMTSDVLIAIYDEYDNMILCDYVLLDGTISFSELTEGKYRASVFMADAPYAATDKSDVNFEVVAGEITEINMTLYKGIGAAKFNVTNATTGNPVAGLVVELFKDGTSIGTYQSDENGQIIIDDMEAGTYTYVVVSVPDGYENVSNNTFDISVDETTIIDIKLTEQTGQVIFNIIDTNSNLLEDLVMIVLTDSEGVEYPYSVENGVLNTGWIKTGTYKVTVLNEVDGYTLHSVTDVVVNADETTTHEIVFKKDCGNATVKVEIQNLDGNLGLANVRVQLRADNNEPIGSYLVDKNGCIQFTDLDIGRYTINVVEDSLPAGYTLLSGAEFTITKGSNENVLLYVLRDTGALQVQVNDNNYFAVENLNVIVKDENGNTVATSKTNTSGQAIFDKLPTGNYTVEVDGENKYSVSGDTYAYVEKDLTTTSNFVVTRYIGTLKVRCNEKVAGIAFEIYDGDTLVKTGVTNENGEAVLEDLPTGNYTVKFTNVPTKYKDVADANVVIENSNETVLNVTLEEKSSTLNVKYVYKLTDYPTAGVQFMVTMLDGTIVGTYTTDDSGAVNVTLPEGYYLVKTTSVPTGYVLPEDTMIEIVEGTDAEIKLELSEVEAFGIFALVVQDSATNAALADVTVSLYTQNGGLYKTFTSDSRGQIYEEDIAAGEYYAVLNKIGYSEKVIETVSIIDGEMFFETVTLDAITEIGTLTVTICDENNNVLKDATVYLRDENDNLVKTLTTDNNGLVAFDNLPYGNYKLSAEANGYVASGRISTIVSSETQTATIKLAKSTTGSLNVTVKSDSGNVVPNAVVLIKNDNHQYALTSDGSGLAALSEIEEGEYTVSVSMDGYEAYSQKFTITANQSNGLEIVLVEVAKGSIEFSVVDENGNALTNASITLSDGSTYETNSEGKVIITDKEVGSYSATLTKDGYLSKNISFSVEKNATTKITATLEKEITTGTLEIVVKDADGNVLANATVVVDDRTLITDENGKVIFTELEAGDYQVDIFKDGYIDKTTQVPITAKATTTLTVTMEKEITTGIVNVVAKDADGNVVENAKVEVSDGKTTQTLYTDATGCVSIELEAGDYTITISKDDYEPIIAQIPVEADNVYTINATLTKEITAGNLEITVVDEDNNALENATVIIDGQSYTTDANGKVVLSDLAAGEYQVLVSKDGYDSFTATVVVNANKVTETSVTLVKTITTGDLTVTVTDTKGNKLEDVSVKVNGASLKTDANGNVTFTDLEAGTYVVEISKDGYVSESHTVVIMANKEISLTVDLDKIDTTGDLVVNVTDTDGNVLKDVTVTVNGNTLTTNADGTVTFEDLEAGIYEVIISKDGYQSQTTMLTIESGKVYTLDAELATEVKTGSAKITVLDAFGKVTNNALVTIKDANGKVVAELRTDHTGEVYISTLETGNYTVEVVYMYTPTEGLSAAGTLSINENQLTNLTINLPAPYVPETTGDVYLTVVDKNGNALKDATVTLNNGTVLSATTMADGTVIFEDLEPGIYSVMVELYGFHAYTTTITVEVGETYNEEITLSAITTGELQLTVTDTDGNALANATIVMDGKTYTTDENGVLLITNVEAGNYKVTASANGYKSSEAFVDVVALTKATCTLTLEKEILRGTGVVIVTDENGNALSNASVTINGEQVVTDAEGKATFANLEVGSYDVLITKDGYHEKITTINITANDTTTITEFLIMKTGNMHIFVYDADGEVLSNATVVVDNKTYTTDEHGKVVISGLMPKSYFVKVLKDGYVEYSTTLSIKPEEVTSHNVYLQKVITTGTLKVTVVDENGNALKNAMVSIDNRNVTTDENGIVTITDIEAGSYEVSVTKDGYTSSKFNATIIAEQTLSHTVMIEKEITTGSLTVTVNDVNGNTLKAVSIIINGVTYATDENGLVTISELEAGTYNVSIQKAGYNIENKTVVIVAKETSVMNVTLTEFIKTGKTTITVADFDTQKTLANATVVIDGKTYTTDENGCVTIELDNGTYNAVISKDKYVSINSTIIIHAGEELSQTVYLKKQTKDITIIVKNNKGEVLENAEVTVYNQILDNPDYWGCFTDSNGCAELTNLALGNYVYTIELDGYHRERGTFTISETSNHELIITLYEKVAEATVEFVVTDKNGNVLSNTNVTVGQYSGVTDENGKLVLMLPIDYNNTVWEYNYTATKDGYITATGKVTIDKTAKATVPVVLEKTPENGKFNVYVRDEAGADIKNAIVIISNGTTVQETLRTNEAGVVELDKLPYGTYSITVIADGYISQVLTAELTDDDCKYITVKLKEVVPPVEYGSVQVTVTDQDGNILSGVAVTIVGKDGKYENVLITDENGQIGVSLETGDYYITAEHNGYIADGKSLNVLANATADVTLVLEKIVIVETSSAEIKLINQLGEDVLNAEVIISNSKGVVVYQGTLTGTSILYLSELEADTYTVTATKANHKAVTATFTTELNATTKVELTLEEVIEEVKAGAFEITVTNENGTPLSRVIVTILNADGTRFGSYTTLSNGTISLTSIPVGDYILYASYNGINSHRVEASVVEEQITTVKIVIDANNPGKPEDENKPVGPGGDNVQTGDNSNVGLYGLMAILSAVGALFTRKSKKNNKD